jgi:vacuolar-type H+-ATPase subunit H
MAIATGTATLIAAGVGLAATGATTGMSFFQANKQKKLQKEAEAEADKAMASARARLDVNYMDALSVQKEPYELQREAMIAQGAQTVDATQESERGTAAAAGRVQMAQNEAQGGIRTAMGKELTEIERLKVAEESRLRDLQTQLDLAEVEGKQMEARNNAEMAAQSTAQGFEGVTSMATQAANLIPLFPKSGGKEAVAGYSGPKASATNNTTLVNPNGTTSQIQTQNLRWNPTGAGMPTLNQNQQPINILGNQMQSNPATSFYPDFQVQVNPFYP